MIILGIDPGYERLGIAVLEKKNGKENLLFSACLKTSAKIPFNERLFLLGKELEKIIKKWKPDIVATEKLFFTTNQKTAMHVSEIRGLIIYLAMLHNAEVRENMESFGTSDVHVQETKVSHQKAGYNVG